jgi:uncharacterized membrane protein YedE/YeeE
VSLLALGTLYRRPPSDGDGVLFLIGGAAGVVLYHAAFGFTSAWRIFIADARGAGLRAQMLMLAVTCAVFFPVLASGQVFGTAVRGSIAPVGVSVIAGAFLFGIGMQLGGGCASGTLYTAGGGNARMLVTLAAFIAGSVAGAAHALVGAATRDGDTVTELGAWPALGTSLLFRRGRCTTIIVERRRHGAVQRQAASTTPRLLRGPWPLVASAVGLATVNVATLMVGGQPGA